MRYHDDVDEAYIRAHVRSISLENFQRLPVTESLLELIAILIRMYSEIQNAILITLGHQPGKDL